MSADGEDDGLERAGRRKDGKPFKAGNTREDGSYEVGKGRTPASTRFAVNDGRARGRRPKGVRNADTEFDRELNRKVTIKENGIERRVSRSQAVDLRLLDNATRKGDNKAIDMVDQRRRRIADMKAASKQRTVEADAAILDAYIREMLGPQSAGPHLLSDPEDGDQPGAAAAGESFRPADEEQSGVD